MSNNLQAFFALVRAGLWEQEARLLPYVKVDYTEVMRLAEEQSVVGLVTAGLEHVVDVKPPKEEVLLFIGQSLQIEQQNQAMNDFIGEMMMMLNEESIDAVLIKGQGVAQYYEKPMWRACGDVDLLLNDENYEKGKTLLKRLSETKPEEYSFNKEYIATVGGWCVELHGTLRCGLSAAVNKGVDDIQREICDNHHVRYWENNGTRIPLPEENEDVMVIFTHFIKHFYKGGLGIRQICDWCRLLWTYRETIDVELLETRLRAMGLVSEWKAFATYALVYLGMPIEAMPLYNENDNHNASLKRKAVKIQNFIVESGNFGHNHDGSYFVKYSFLVRKAISMWRRVGVLFQHASIFPLDSFRFFPYMFYNGIRNALRGE